MILPALVRKNAILLAAASIRLPLMLFLPTIALYLAKSAEISIQNFIQPSNNIPTANDFSSIYATIQSKPLRQCRWFDIYGGFTREYTNDCVTILYAPPESTSVEDFDKIMDHIGQETGLRVQSIARFQTLDHIATYQHDIVGVPSFQHVAEFLARHQGRASGLVLFREMDPEFRIDLAYNNTMAFDQLQSLQSSVSNAIIALSINTRFNVTARVRDFSAINKELQTERDETDVETLSTSLITTFIMRRIMGTILGAILSIGYAITAMLLLLVVSREKTQGLIGALRSIGVQDSYVWCSWIIIAFAVYGIDTIFVLIAASGFDLILLSDINAAFTLYLVLLIYGVAIFCSLMVFVAIFNRPKVVIGMFGLMFIVITVFSLVSADDSLFLPTSTSGTVYGILFPCFHLQKFMYRMSLFANETIEAPLTPIGLNQYDMSYFFQDVGRCVSNQTNLTQPCIPLPLLKLPWMADQDDVEYLDCKVPHIREWYQQQNDQSSNYACALEEWYYYIPSDFTILLTLLLQSGGYFLATWYLFNVIPSGNGQARPPWFVLNPNYWFMSLQRRFKQLQDMSSRLPEAQLDALKNKSIRIENIRKDFSKFRAVNDLSLNIPNGQVYVILGHNGAGKSTLINILTGKIPPSNGSAYLAGLSIRDDMNFIREITGIVPQHDLLWSDLSANEHIRLYSKIKGAKEEADMILKRVSLMDAKDLAAGRYSGGMKRRLSIALAGIGDPTVLIMDEPTTGIDPYNRRRIWHLVEQLKHNRIVLLTTHAMQEADVLGDYIAVMDRGSVQASGTALSLKKEYGKGYTVTMLIPSRHVTAAKDALSEFLQFLQLESKGNEAYSLSIPKDREDVIPALTKILDETKLFREWTIALASLEDVFLILAEESHKEQETTKPDNAEQPSCQVKVDVAPAKLEELSLGIDQVLGPISLPQQIRGHLIKLMRLQKFNWIINLIQIGLPFLLFIGFDMLQTEVIEPPRENEGMIMVVPNGYVKSPNQVYINGDRTLEQDVANCAYQWEFLDQPMTPNASIFDPDGVEAMLQSGFDTIAKSVSVELKTRIVVSNASNIDQIHDAVVEAIETSLKQTKDPSKQSLADAYCSGRSQCGSCHWRSNPELSIIEESHDRFLVTLLYPYYETFWRPTGSFCESNSLPCLSHTMRRILEPARFKTRLTEALGSGNVTVEPVTTHYGTIFDKGLKIQSGWSHIRDSSIGHYNPFGSDLRLDDTSLWISGSDRDIELVKNHFGSTFGSYIVQNNIEEKILTAQTAFKAAEVDIESLESDFDWSGCKVQLQNFETFNSREEGFWRKRFVLTNETPAAVPNTTQIVETWSESFPSRGLSIETFNISSSFVDLKLDLYDYLKTPSQPGGYFGDIVVPYYHTTLLQPICTDQNGSGVCAPNSRIECLAFSGSQSWYQGDTYNDPSDAVNVYMASESVYNLAWELIKQKEPTWNVQPSRLVFQHLTLMDDFQTVEYVAATTMWDFGLCTISILTVAMFLFPTIVYHLKLEKEDRFIFMMQINGLRIESYYLAMYVYYSCFGFIAYLIALLIGVILGSKPLLNDANYSHLFLLGFTFQYALFGTALFFSILPLRRRLMMTLCYSIVLFCMIVPILLLHPDLTSYETFQHLPIEYYFIPPVSMARGIFLSLWGRKPQQIWEIIGMFLFTGTLYGYLGLYISMATGVGATRSLYFWRKTRQSDSKIEQEDDVETFDDKALADMYQDVIEARNVALSLSPQDSAIVIHHLSKHFGPKKAVNDLSLSIKYGECFALLGPNGAGKTTTISMLIGQFASTSGQSWINGYETGTDQAMRSLGIVPQFDVLYDDLTVCQHLEFYSALKGIKRAFVSKWCLKIAATVALDGSLYHRESKRLSGGMKRRLSIAVSLISDPRTLFLDEPTTGLDPEIKRSVWGVIETLKREQKCIVLTTHGMDEAEKLCDRVGIMTKGRLRCVAPITRLRKRFGRVLELSFTLIRNQDEKMETYIRAFASTAVLTSSYGPTRVYSIEKDQVNDMSSLFSYMQQGVRDNLYSEWGISQTSLDEVFCSIAADSEEH